MSNKYGLPEEDLRKIRARDIKCVYCHKAMQEYRHTKGTPNDKATIEHLNKDGPFYWNKSVKFDPSVVAICCGRCNKSRGKRDLLDWFKTKYCTNSAKAINEKTVAEEPVKEYIRMQRNLEIFSINQLSSQLKQIIENSKWIFAKTMPDTPHYYVVKDNLSEDDKKMFNGFEWFIKKNGYDGEFYSKKYKYFNIGNYKYWVIGNILNRAKLNL